MMMKHQLFSVLRQIDTRRRLDSILNQVAISIESLKDLKSDRKTGFYGMINQ